MKSKKVKVKSQKSEIGLILAFYLLPFAFFPFSFFLFSFALPVAAQRIAVITPQKTEFALKYSEKFESSLSEKVHVLDDSLSEAAYLSVSPATPFNMTVDLSKQIGAAIGCDSFILIRSATQRRSAYLRNEY